MYRMISLLGCLLLLTISFGAPSALAVNKVLSLDGDGDYVDAGTSDIFNFGTENFAIEAWINPNNLSNWIRLFISKGGQSPFSGWAFYVYSDGRLGFGGLGYWEISSPTNTITTNAWQHVVVVRDGDTYKLYKNGVNVATLNRSGSLETSTLSLKIGMATNYPDNSFSGLIDEVRIWNVARTQEEIRADMNQPIENPESLSNLVGYWNFDDGTADDLSQYGNDGTLQGDATIVESELATVIFVPTPEYPTIQDGIDAANPGDIVVVDPGIYDENVTLKSGIRLQGAGADVTVITAGSWDVVYALDVIDTTISGFTIDGQDTDETKGIACKGSTTITIMSNTIQFNVEGIVCGDSASATILTNTIHKNRKAGINCGGTSSAAILGNTIQGSSWGIVGSETSSLTINSNMIQGNDYAGIGCLGSVNTTISNNAICNNKRGVLCEDSPSLLIGGSLKDANDIFGNTEYAVRNDSTNTINATYNYWGTTVEDEIRVAIWDFYDDDSKGVVNYEPWIDGAHRKLFPFAQAVSLDGDGDYVRIGNDPILAPDNLTIEAWFNPTDIRSCHIISRYEDSEQSYEIYLPGDGRIRYQVVNSSGKQFWFDAGRIDINNWQHVAIAFDGSQIKGYLNGIQVGEVGFDGIMNKPDIPLLIGASRDGVRYFFYGFIDEVRIWNYVRTQEEIQADMNQPLENPQSIQNLVGYFSFDDGTANDSSLHSGNHGTLMGDAEIVPLYGTWPPPLRGDVSGDGTVSAYDAALILQYVVGLIDVFPADSMVSPSASELHDYELSLPKMEISAGKRIQVPIAIDDATGLLAGGITIKYDSTVLRAVDYASLKLLNGYYWKANTNLPGEVRFAFATTEPTKGQGNLLMVEFEVLPNTEGKTSPLILENVNFSNSRSITKNNGEVHVIPSTFALLQNFPNPFNPDTWLPYKLASDSPVSISIYNAKGQLIRTLHLGYQNAGVYVAKGKAAYWDGKDNVGEKVSSGMYFYTLQVERQRNPVPIFGTGLDGAEAFTATRKMVIMK